MGNTNQNNLSNQSLIETLSHFNAQTRKPYFTQVFKYYLDAKPKAMQKGIKFFPAFSPPPHSVQIKVCELDSGKPIYSVILQKWEEFYEVCGLVDSIRESQLNIQVNSQPKNSSQQESNVCVLCFEKDNKIVLSCGHVYCQICIEDWLIVKNKDTCPMCRGSVTKQNDKLDSFYLGDDKETEEYIDAIVDEQMND